MSLLTRVLLAPITLPSKGLIYVFEKIMEQAEGEFNDPTKIRAALVNLQQRLDSRDLTLERYDAAEAVLLDRLDAIEERRTAEQRTARDEIAASQPKRKRRRRRL